jgi:hypothetical protein
VNLIACLSWYDEQPAWLAELVASLTRAGATHIVAVDGAYVLYPGAQPRSPSEQAHAIIGTAAGVGIGATVHAPSLSWIGNETEKRRWMFSAAALIAESLEDWLLVIDADELIDTASGLLEALQRTDLDVAEVLLGSAAGWAPARRLFRAQRDPIVVWRRHCLYQTRDGSVLWDQANPGQQVPAESIWDVRIRHRHDERDQGRQDRQRTYCERRDELKVEIAC